MTIGIDEPPIAIDRRRGKRPGRAGRREEELGLVGRHCPLLVWPRRARREEEVGPIRVLRDDRRRERGGEDGATHLFD